ncbi:FG-GAP-like repeat-containing protein [Sphingomonas yunnanensis]|uniref:FG-GAP-like repeat-containing protein n=1 Tax=Sphingomonas yunnanensis TaxID=310400 RepID=UPI0031B9EAB8
MATDTDLLLVANPAAPPLTGSDGADVLAGVFANETLTGGSGNDWLSGGGGSDILIGGPGRDTFRDTAAGLNGDTITDFQVGDRIVISDASPSQFAFSLSGHTLTYTGGAVTLTNLPSEGIRATALAGGGVQLTIGAPTSFETVRHDFNNDGHSDVLWRNADGSLSNWLGQPNGGSLGNDSNAFVQVTKDWHVAGSTDVNGDGHADLVWRSDAGGFSTWLGTSTGGFVGNDAAARTQVDTAWQVVGAGDFNGDGRGDVLWRHADGTLSDWLGRGDGGFTPNHGNARAQVGTEWRVVGTGDINGDGRADILWRHSDGSLSDWLGRADGGFTGNDAAAFVSRVSAAWSIVDTGDYNGDGRDDILWRSQDGALSDWLGRADGSFVANDANAYVPVPVSWQTQHDGMHIA